MRTIKINLSTSKDNTQEVIRYAYQNHDTTGITKSFQIASGYPVVTQVIITIGKFVGTEKELEIHIKKLFQDRMPKKEDKGPWNR